MNVLELFGAALIHTGLLTAVSLALSFEALKRKIEARMQNRMGPTYTGLRGLAQPLIDLVKLLGKEDIAPLTMHEAVAAAALVWSVSLAAFACLLLPWGLGGLGDIGYNALLVPVCLSLAAALLGLASLSTRSPYSVIGGLRFIGLLMSYDIGLISLVGVAYAATGSLNMDVIRAKLWEGLVHKPFLFPLWLLALLVGFILVQADLGEDPFTIAEAETEVAGGFEAEFSGRKLAFMRLGHEVHGVTALLFYVSLLLAPQPSQGVFAVMSLLAIGLLIALLSIIVDASTPRIRLKDMIKLSWGYLVPLSILIAFLSLMLGGATS